MRKVSKRNKGTALVSKILNYYTEYVTNGYPKDPNIYKIRAHPDTVQALIKADESVIHNLKNHQLLEGDTFMGFSLEADSRLGPGELIFGPETVTIFWSN